MKNNKEGTCKVLGRSVVFSVFFYADFCLCPNSVIITTLRFMINALLCLFVPKVAGMGAHQHLPILHYHIDLFKESVCVNIIFKIRCFSHISRSSGLAVKMTLQGTMTGKRFRCTQQKKWEDNIKP